MNFSSTASYPAAKPQRIMNATARSLSLALAVSFLPSLVVSNADAALFFTEDFSGTTLSPEWSQIGAPGGHDGLTGSGQYFMSDVRDGAETALRRSTGGSASSFAANLDVSFDPFRDPNTQTDFNWRFFGPDGFVEVVFNSFGDIRVFSNNAGGNVGGPLRLEDFVDTDTLNLSLTYDLGADTFDVGYAINDGAATNLATYTGAGNFYTNFTDARMFKFGENEGPATAALDSFNIVPEPASTALLGIWLSCLLLVRRRDLGGK